MKYKALMITHYGALFLSRLASTTTNYIIFEFNKFFDFLDTVDVPKSLKNYLNFKIFMDNKTF